MPAAGAAAAAGEAPEKMGLINGADVAAPAKPGPRTMSPGNAGAEGGGEPPRPAEDAKDWRSNAI